MPVSATGPEIWVLGSSPHSARLAAQPGRPYAFALQFGDADVDTTMRLYREEFQPSELLAEPHTLVSVSAAISDDPAEAKRQASTSAMAILRMFKREGYLRLPPNEVEEYSATTQERTKADEVALVVVGHSAEQDQHGLELLADHYNLPHPTAPDSPSATQGRHIP